MPVLHYGDDGHAFVHRFQGDHQTWQVTAAGLRFLRARGVIQGRYFSQPLFFEAQQSGYVFTGRTPPRQSLPRVLIAERDPELSRAVSALHFALRRSSSTNPVEEPLDASTQGQIESLMGRVRRWSWVDQQPLNGPPGMKLVELRIGLWVDGFRREFVEEWVSIKGTWRLGWMSPLNP